MTRCPNNSMDSPTTSLADAAAAARAAQRAYLRQTSEDRPTSLHMMAEEMETEEWTVGPENGQFLSPPPMRLTDLLPLIRLRDTDLAGPPRPAQNAGRLTNADIIATIEQVLDIVGHVDDEPLNPAGDDVDPAVSS